MSMNSLSSLNINPAFVKSYPNKPSLPPMSGSQASPSRHCQNMRNITDLYVSPPQNPRQLLLYSLLGGAIGSNLRPALGAIKNGIKWSNINKELWRTAEYSYLSAGAIGILYCLFGYEHDEAVKRTLDKNPKAKIKDLLNDSYYQGHSFRTNLLLKMNKLIHPSLKLPD